MKVELTLKDQDDFVDWMNALRRAEIEYDLDSVDTEDEFYVEMTLHDPDDLSKLLMAHPCKLVAAQREEAQAAQTYVFPQQPQVWPTAPEEPQWPQWLREATGQPSTDFYYTGDPIGQGPVITSGQDGRLVQTLVPASSGTVMLGEGVPAWSTSYLSSDVVAGQA